MSAPNGDPPDIRVDNVVNLLELRGGENRGRHRVLEKLQPGGNKPPHGTVANATVILMHDPELAGLLAFNEFTGAPVLLRAPPAPDRASPDAKGPYPRPWMKSDISLVLSYIQASWLSHKMTESAVKAAMDVVASMTRFHPIRDWLDSMQWDGVERLDTWLSEAYAVPDTSYHRAVGAKFLIAAVRRVRHPGCKFDYMLILKGRQGLLKSTSIDVLFHPWFSDSLHTDLTSKDAPISLIGYWGIELPEIEHLIRSTNEEAKAFLSKRIDRYRPPYGIGMADVPRQSVLVGTTNEDDFLRDPTGNRRYWPIECTDCRIEWLRENRAQLWAEASVRESGGELTWLTDFDQQREAAAAQESSAIEDPWTAKVMEYVLHLEQVTAADVLTNAIHMETAKQTRKEEMRVTAILKTRKWRRKKIRVGRTTPWGWVAPAEADQPVPSEGA